VTLKVAVPSSAAAERQARPFAARALPIALAMLVLPFLLPQRRKWRGWFTASCLAVLALGAVWSLSGCGGGGGKGGGGGSPQTYNLTMTATTGSISQSIKLTLTVQ
jgi:hypothetical protein